MPMQSSGGRRSPDRDVDDRFGREGQRTRDWGTDRDDEQVRISRERETGYDTASVYRGEGRDETWRERAGSSREDPREALRRRVSSDDRSFARSDEDRFGRGFENRGFESRDVGGGYESRGGGRADENRRFGQGVGRLPSFGGSSGSGFGMNEQRSGDLGRSIGSIDERMYGHRGKGPRNFTRSDERIREMACEALADDDRIDASQIDIQVRDGEVTLSGTVEERKMKRLAEDVIEDLPGVQEVHNHIRGPGLFGRNTGGSVSETIEQLNSLLRGEISAVETYRMALDKLDRGSHARSELETCIRSHDERVNVLRDKVRQLGGTPATSSGPWGVFARLVEGGARALGDKAAIGALEEGEDHGLKDYRTALEKLDSDGRQLVQSRLLPAQEDTHARMSAYKRRLGSSGAAS